MNKLKTKQKSKNAKSSFSELNRNYIQDRNKKNGNKISEIILKKNLRRIAARFEQGQNKYKYVLENCLLSSNSLSFLFFRYFVWVI
jgi:hypothetical protein